MKNLLQPQAIPPAIVKHLEILWSQWLFSFSTWNSTVSFSTDENDTEKKFSIFFYCFSKEVWGKRFEWGLKNYFKIIKSHVKKMFYILISLPKKCTCQPMFQDWLWAHLYLFLSGSMPTCVLILKKMYFWFWKSACVIKEHYF